ncbi:MAG: hypothetical protein C4525_09825 [Desulfarculus sp.]|nr:MAG: hypothetical protein C4525_09825 [Desulfarculus sp.]
MANEEFIQALQQSVKQEIVQNYFRERRIIEEEIVLVTEAASAFLGGLAAWDRAAALLGRALLSAQGRKLFFALAGLEPPDPRAVELAAPAVGMRPIRGLTHAGRYQSLVAGLYQGLWEQAQELKQERQRALDLLQEVNGDIRAFEANHDLMGLAAYLRSLDPAELQRRKILGVNFTAAERALSAEALSFKPLKVAAMGLDHEAPSPRPPRQVLAEAKDILQGLARERPQELRRFL